MFAAHLAAGLAVKAVEPRAPTAAVLAGAFLPDLAWIVFSVVGLETARSGVFFDGWSHSVASIVAEATVFAALFLRCGWRVQAAIWAAVASHILLDGAIHPSALQLYPHAALTGPDLWTCGQAKAWLGFSRYWWVETVVTVGLLGVYAKFSRRLDLAGPLVAASMALAGGLHFFV